MDLRQSENNKYLLISFSFTCLYEQIHFAGYFCSSDKFSASVHFTKSVVFCMSAQFTL